MTFIESNACTSRSHCAMCRMSAIWRTEMNAPDECPFGVTAQTAIEQNPTTGNKKTGLGDMVKTVLSAVGITEERVSKALGRPCGCGKRAEALNELGRKIGIG